MRTIYATYEFRGEKDPVIWIVKTVIQLYAIEKRMTFGGAVMAVAGKARVSPRTLWGWFGGKTRTPKFETLAAVIHAAGESITVAGERVTGHNKFRALKSVKRAA